jgi:AcrR family transcriptional regulator
MIGKPTGTVKYHSFMASSSPPAAADTALRHRRRLLEGMARAMAAQGYADTTIADIVREAAVSRRTFYEHFETKADCLIALYEAASVGALKVLQGSLDPAQDWRVQVERALAAYYAHLAAHPALVRTLFVEIGGLGLPGLAARRRVVQAMADFIVCASDGAIAPVAAVTIVGGIHELVLMAVEQGRIGQLPDLVPATAALVRAMAAMPQGGDANAGLPRGRSAPPGARPRGR